MRSMAYLSGVLHGDGWCAKDVGLRVKDRDFIDAFVLAANEAFQLALTPRFDGYWVARTKRVDLFSPLRTFEPRDDSERAAWVRGLFDSEGNATLRLNGISVQSYGRRVAIYSTNLETLNKAATYLTALTISTRLRATKNSAGHKGVRTVYELSLVGGRENYAKFASIVGSSIARKASILEAIPHSYRPDPSAHARAAQRLGATEKHRRTMEITLPAVVKGVRALIDQGVKPTQRACRVIPGYSTIQKHVPQAALVEMALKL